MDRKLPTGISIRKNKNGGTINISFMYKGLQCRESLIGVNPDNKGIRYADNLRREILSRIARNDFLYHEYFPESNTKFSKLFGSRHSKVKLAVYIEKIEWEHVAPKMTTAYTYRKDCKWVINALGHIQICDLTSRDIRDWVKSMTHLNRKTISNRLTPLRIALALAVDDCLIDSNPADKVNLGKSSRGLISHSQRRSKEKIDPFSIKEITAILSVAREHSINARNYYQTRFFTGMRASEANGLRQLSVDNELNIDLDNRILWIRSALVSMGGKCFEQSPKTENGYRSINLTPMALAALQSQKNIIEDEHGYVFSRPDGGAGPITHNDHYYYPWRDILKEARVRYRPPKQMRHTFASQLLSGNENPMYVATQMGHADVMMIFKRYGKWISNQSYQAHNPVSDYGQLVLDQEIDDE